MGFRFSRHLGPVTSLLPGQWTHATASGEPALCCPRCECISDIDPKYVQVGGSVDREWQCPAVSCSYLAFITLEAWGEEVV